MTWVQNARLPMLWLACLRRDHFRRPLGPALSCTQLPTTLGGIFFLPPQGRDCPRRRRQPFAMFRKSGGLCRLSEAMLRRRGGSGILRMRRKLCWATGFASRTLPTASLTDTQEMLWRILRVSLGIELAQVKKPSHQLSKWRRVRIWEDLLLGERTKERCRRSFRRRE
jgi:hypothetical protein